MNRRAGFTACLMTLLLAAAACGQSNGLIAETTDSSQNSATTANAATTTDANLGIKAQLRAGFAQLLTDAIRNLFSEIRTSFGLPAAPTVADTDPLAILESIITEAVDTAMTPR